jgi:hypothetical protein
MESVEVHVPIVVDQFAYDLSAALPPRTRETNACNKVSTMTQKYNVTPPPTPQ